MLVTAHWSATGPIRLRDYHVEFSMGFLDKATYDELYEAKTPDKVNWEFLKSCTIIYKNVDFETPTTYGTWDLNRDPRDSTSNIEVAALCMGGTDVKTVGPWGQWPYTKAHAWMQAAIIARICDLKKLDANASFPITVEPDVLQNGPIYLVSTHGERAMQTNDQGQSNIPSAGYFDYSGDPNCRGDLAALDERDAHLLDNLADAERTCKESAAWIRQQAHNIKSAGISDYWNLDLSAT